MLSWWTNMESVATLSGWMLMATLIFAALTIIMVFLNAGNSKLLARRLSDDLEASRKRIHSLEKAAEEIRKELLKTQHHQDINQLKLKTSDSSTKELRQALLDAKKRLKIAEAAISAHQKPKDDPDKNKDENTELVDLELELEPQGSLTKDQCEQLIDLLDPGPKGHVDIYCVMDDQNSALTARQLDEIMAADGWKTNGVAQSAFANPPKGLLLAVNSKETAPSYASFLQRVFSTIGVEVSAKLDSKCREWSLSIIVGTMKS